MIDGRVLIGLGIIVTIVSLLSPASGVKLFAAVGVVFIVWGAIRYFLSKKETPTPKKNKEVQQSHITQCPSCQYHIHHSYNFCPRCGHKLK